MAVPRDKTELVETPFQRFRASFFASKVATVALVVLSGLIFVAVFAGFISPTNPYDLAQVSVLDSKLPPGAKSFEGTVFWLGTDGAGRDLLSAMIYGLRISLGVGVMSGIVAMIIGAAFGLIAAYFGGRTENIIMRIVDIQLSFPAILVALILLAMLGKGVDKIIIALIIVQWAVHARTVRGSALVERTRNILKRRHVWLLAIEGSFSPPQLNCMPPLIVVGTLQTASAISLEATLSFLGVGLPVSEPSLGLLIANGFDYMLSGKYWISFFPGVALLITIVSINLVGDQLRDVLNPRLEK